MENLEFRAWDKLKNQMISANIIDFRDNSVASVETFDGYKIEGNLNFELMQWTGLKDKNGTKIFTGDILSKETNNIQWCALVKWKGANFTASTYILDEDEEGQEYWREQYASHPIEGLLTYKNIVIGNIYENPELLKTTEVH
jgi:uncharacterized phage protein (TIGR01671 family)